MSFYSVQVIIHAYLAQLLHILRGVLIRFGVLPDAARPGDSSISPAWISSIIRSSGFKDCAIKSIDFKSGQHRGLVGQITFISIEYENPGSTAPTSLVLKMTQPGYQGRKATIVQGSYREAWFYTSPKFAHFSKVRPKAFYAHGSKLFGECVLLQENISSQGGVPVNYIFGNQIWGIPKPLETPFDEVDSLKFFFNTAAQLHSAFWKDSSILKIDWLKGSQWYHGAGRSAWEAAINRGLESWKFAKVKASQPGSELKFSERLVNIIDKAYTTTSWKHLQSHLKDKNVPWTLCHGDFHASNMFLLAKSEIDPKTASIHPVNGNDVAVMFDWSEVGPWEPTTDLAQMIISDVKPSISSKHAKNLVKSYWNTLISHGISEQEYPFDYCWESFCRGGAERWIWVFCALAAFPLPANAIQYFHDQLLAFLDNHCSHINEFHLKPVVLLL